MVTAPAAFGIWMRKLCLSFYVTVDAICSFPSTHLFWDAIHPTVAGHGPGGGSRPGAAWRSQRSMSPTGNGSGFLLRDRTRMSDLTKCAAMYNFPDFETL